MVNKEAKARIKINKLLEEAGWRFEDTKAGPRNILLEANFPSQEMGDDYEHIKAGFIDYLLMDQDNKPLVVLEAKRESIDPLFAKEQARVYARKTGARYILLSNGNIHYLWDTKEGNPTIITRFPSQASLTEFKKYTPNFEELASAKLDEYYIVESQMPGYDRDPDFKIESSRDSFLQKHNLKKLRDYQVKAILALQASAKQRNQRFLFEMATGTGKTLISAAVIKLFLKTGNARRVLFLVDRLELEHQAFKAFTQYLGKDYSSMIYKDNRDVWGSAQIVISTIQTFLSNDRYRKEFSPTDFELVISDEAHRSIGGNSRAVFEYFVGYKLGLTATPKDYLKGYSLQEIGTQREFERRQLHDTYKTFGCESGSPTYRYDLLAGVKDGYLINPVIVDARTEITTQLLSEDGLAVHQPTEEGDVVEFVANQRDYEKKIYNDETNVAMCKAFLDNAMMDPLSVKLGNPLIGKTILFCVSQKHAGKITNILNKMAMERWPNLYNQSDFAMQVTSHVMESQQMTINFANNRLGGQTPFPPGYETSKTRVCVTVGMMTTGYDCQDILNLALMRPVFSPSEFIQMKGRGTRTYTFTHHDYDTNEVITAVKERYKLFDFFATCEYFEEDFNYDEKLKLPRERIQSRPPPPPGLPIINGEVDLNTADRIKDISLTQVGYDGMRPDREMFKPAVQEDVLSHPKLQALWKAGDVLSAEEYTKREIFDNPKHFLNLDKIKKMFNLNRRITVREFLEVAFGEKESFPTKEELVESEWLKFVTSHPVDPSRYIYVKNFFKAYLTDPEVQRIIESKRFADLNVRGSFDFEDYKKLGVFKTIVPTYIKDYINLNIYMN